MGDMAVSYIRFNQPRVYCEGNSNAYVFSSANGIEFYVNNYETESAYPKIVMKNEDFLEVVINAVSRAGVTLTLDQTKKLAEELDVKTLRPKPLTNKEWCEIYDKQLEDFKKQ